MRHVLPHTWAVAGEAVSVGGAPLKELAERHGTPLIVVDAEHFERRLAAFRGAFGPETRLAYAGKAFLCGALVRVLDARGWLIDVVSPGELELVRRAGFPMERVVLHGNAKTPAELEGALRLGVGRVVIDHPAELELLREASRHASADPPARILLRLNVDLDPATHEKVKTVGPTAHFGMEPAEAAQVARVAARAGLGLDGVHIHAGSQIRDLAVFEHVAEAAVAFVEPLRPLFPDPVELDVGGGLAVAYMQDDQAISPDDYARAICRGLSQAGASERLGRHRLLVEPGRSVVANAGLTLYRVQARKRLPGLGHVLAADGGLSDNPRPSLYGARYEVLNVSRPDEPHEGRFRVVGRHCESGDVIAPEARLPATSDTGDLLAIPATGAYVFAMSSRYNGVGRPAVVFAAAGESQVVLRRETHDDLLACDMCLQETVSSPAGDVACSSAPAAS